MKSQSIETVIEMAQITESSRKGHQIATIIRYHILKKVEECRNILSRDTEDILKLLN
jgi:hypothetical protein